MDKEKVIWDKEFDDMFDHQYNDDIIMWTNEDWNYAIEQDLKNKGHISGE